VFRNVSAHGCADLIAINTERGEALLLDAKSRSTAALSLRQQQLGVQVICPAPGGVFAILPPAPPPDPDQFTAKVRRALERQLRSQRAEATTNNKKSRKCRRTRHTKRTRKTRR
jgi:hypothetical protein